MRLLAGFGVEWILTGSTVLAVYGARLVPNDVDVTPALERDNLQRLAGALRSVEAVPAFFPDWEPGLSMQQCRDWRPEPVSERSLDHLFVTRLGMLDVPPRVCGTYAELIGQATRIDVGGETIAVCDPTQVLARLDGRTRAKDQERAAIYAEVRAQVSAGAAPTGVAWLLDQLAQTPAGGPVV